MTNQKPDKSDTIKIGEACDSSHVVRTDDPTHTCIRCGHKPSKPDTTLREELAKVMDEFTVKPMPNDPYYVRGQSAIIDQILNTIAKRLPQKKKHSIVCKVNTRGYEDRQCDCSAYQVNQTLSDVRVIIERTEE